MRFPAQATVAGLSLSLTAGTAWGADVCARASDVVALQVAAVQQQLMVAALTCDDVSLYNSFVITYQQDLVASDEKLQGFFAGLGEAEGATAYHAFKTKMANLYSARSAADKRRFCASVRASFAPALKAEKLNLASFALSQPSFINEPYTNCGDTVAGGAMMARPPAAPAGNVLTAQSAADSAKAAVAGPLAAGQAADRPLSAALGAGAAARPTQQAQTATAGSAGSAAASGNGPATRSALPNPNVNPQRDRTQSAQNRDPYRGLPQSYRDRLAQQRAAAQQRASEARARYRAPYDGRGYFWPADRYWQFCYTRYGERLPCAEAAQRFRSNRFYYRAPSDGWGYSPGR